MDRLFSLIRPHSACLLGLLGVLGCDDDKPAETTGAPPSRFEAVTQKASSAKDMKEELDGFCDIGKGKKVSLPDTEDPVPAAKGPRWVNLWATWCKSCVDEMPMIAKWEKQSELDVVFISADEEPEVLGEFVKKHPELPESTRMKDVEGLEHWMKDVGLDKSTGLPLHLFLNKRGKLLCARGGAVKASHEAVINYLLKK